MVSVYVSYAWSEEKQNQLVDTLEAACKARGISLGRDTKRIAYGESIRAFMDKLGAAKQVVLVLSDSYFRSRFCMYELCKIFEHGEFRQRVHPIVLGENRLSEPQERISLVKHWSEKAQELQQELNGLASGVVNPPPTAELRQLLANTAQNQQRMDLLIGILADMNTLTEEEHRRTDFAAVLDRIERQAKIDAFHSLICTQIRAILDRHGALRKTLDDQVYKSHDPTAADLATTLCALPPDKAIGALLFPATTSCLKTLIPQSADFDQTWRAARSLLAWISLLAVDYPQIASTRTPAESNGQLAFELMVKTPLGVEVVSAYAKEMAPQLRVDRSQVVGEHAINPPSHETGWGNATYDDLLLAIWKSVFPEESRSSLSAVDRQNLNATLRFRDTHKTHHHYLAVLKNSISPQTHPEIFQRLSDEFPQLTVIFFHCEGGKSELLISDEIDFMVTIREFLSLSRNPE